LLEEAVGKCTVYINSANGSVYHFSGGNFVRPERVNKWPNSMTDIWWCWWILFIKWTDYWAWK